eukprot:scaffold11809_cov128-Cylindrotheca_fusiformis.AAC.28
MFFSDPKSGIETCLSKIECVKRRQRFGQEESQRSRLDRPTPYVHGPCVGNWRYSLFFPANCGLLWWCEMGRDWISPESHLPPVQRLKPLHPQGEAGCDAKMETVRAS